MWRRWAFVTKQPKDSKFQRGKGAKPLWKPSEVSATEKIYKVFT